MRCLVLPLIGAANRDPLQFAHADRFDVSRTPNSHVAFGHGVHFCLGAALSRLEARAGLRMFLGRMRAFEHAGDGAWRPRRPFNVHRPAELPIRFELA